MQNQVSRKRHLPNPAHGRLNRTAKRPAARLPDVRHRIATTGETAMTQQREKLEYGFAVLASINESPMERNYKSALVLRMRTHNERLTPIINDLIQKGYVKPLVVTPKLHANSVEKSAMRPIVFYRITPEGQQALKIEEQQTIKNEEIKAPPISSLKRGRLEMKLSILENTQPTTIMRNSITPLMSRVNLSYNIITELIGFLMEKKLLEIILRPSSTRYSRKPSSRKWYVITPAGQRTLENVKQSGLME